MVREVPVFRTDAEAEAFLGQDLSDLDFSQFVPMQDSAVEAQDRLDLSLPRSLLKVLEARAEAAGIPTAIYIKALLEQAVAS